MVDQTKKPVWRDDGTLQHLGTPAWLSDPALQSLMTAYEAAGFEIYAVGGCVRDTVLGRHVADVDLSTNAHPNDSIQIIKSLTTNGTGWKAIPTGIDHGTVTALMSGTAQGYEITTFRADIETDGRHATVAFSNDITDDANRRDFTINAFYADRHGQVTDIVGGSADLAARRIRFIGDPTQRIEEDFLRILRFFRFTATHGDRAEGVDADGLAACAMLADGLQRVSNERIGVEITKLLMDADPAPIIGSMEHTGVLLNILPGASSTTLARLIDLEETTGETSSKNLATRLASLGSDDLQNRLRLSNDVARKIDLVKREAGAVTPPHELGYRYGHDDAVHCLLLRWASLLAPLDPSALTAASQGATATFPVSAADLMPTYTGKALGDRLKTLEAAWIASHFTSTKSALLALP